MLSNGNDAMQDPPQRLEGRLWRFGKCEYDETTRQLRVEGRVTDLESKPLDVLQQLLLHAGEVLTKDELLEAVWPGLNVVDGSLATAVSKLRKAIGDEDQTVILTVPRIGYRLGAPVQSKRVSPPAMPELGFQPGGVVPGRDQWRLTRKLDVSLSSEVWLAEHAKTGDRRVFKFAADGLRLQALKREVTIARFLQESLGARPVFVRVLEWNFEQHPYYIESEYSGVDLNEWAQSQGGLSAVPIETRLRVLTDVARALASAHAIGVLHKDLKPANILISPAGAGWQVRVADFGSGSLLEPGRLDQFGITNLGFSTGEGPVTGTPLYVAPEVLAGQSPTALADIYAMGVVLYQLAVGDFRRPLSPGWESDVADPLIREDIAEAACGDPRRRLNSVAALADRLDSLEQRRARRGEVETATERARIAEQQLARARARRPWAVAAMLLLLTGLAAALALYRNAAEERTRANRQQEIAESVNRFLADDLLGRGNPFLSGKSGESLVDAIRLASGDIDRQFRNEPQVAARLHHAIAKAFDNRTDYTAARVEYTRAADLYRKAGGDLAPDALVVRLQQAAMEARTYTEGSLARAQAILKEEEAKIPRLRRTPEALPVWLASARGMIALISNDAKLAAAQFQTAYERSRTIPGFDEMGQLTLKQRMAFAHIRMGDGPRAEHLFRELISDFTRLHGADSPNVLRVRLNLAQAFMIQGKHKDAVAETTAIYPHYVERLGEDHELAMQVLTTRAESEGAQGMWEEAIRDDLKIHQLAVRKQGPLSFFAIATESDAALAMCRAGRIDEGAGHALRAYQSSVKGFGPRAGLTGGVAHTLANCWIQQGKLADASRVLEEIDVAAVAQLAGSKDWHANLELSRAEIAYRQGNFDSARRLLQAAAPVLSRADAEPYQKRALERLMAAVPASQAGK
ncbi:MAG: winged helix-turn-helix domain-containing protein [Bryobacteraceae bacterium]|nr:winged helix-turn-helix domain-containing protein [Bryobacteraceae bacterium]